MDREHTFQMLYIGLFILELIILFVFSKQISIEISRLFFLLTRHDKAANYLLALLFLPGTLVHELAHYLMAVIVRVKAVHFTLLPKIGNDSIILGSVGVLKSDLFRRFLIGVSPFLVGTSLVLLISQYYISHSIPIFSWLNLLFVYLLFTLSNTMFSSKKDMEGTLQLALILGGVIAILYLFGLRPEHLKFDISWIYPTFEKTFKLLLIPLGIDVIFLFTISMIRSVYLYLTRTNIVD